MPKVALVHDWLTGMRGGERCLEVFCEIFPEADLYTLLHIRGSVSPGIERMQIHSSLLQSLPPARKKYRYFLPVMPALIQRFDLSGYDLILSSSHCVAKGARKGPHARHLCYCFSPMRYIWDQRDAYFGREGLGTLEGFAMSLCVKYLKNWDRRTSRQVDRFIAISKFVSGRIRDAYGRESGVIYPPVNTSFYLPQKGAGGFFLMVSALAPYKRVDLAIRAFNRLRLPLKIVGTGQMEARLRTLAADNIEFLGWRSDTEVRDLYAACRAFVFPGVEDFGITPLEAQSCGRPVIAFGGGGALETVLPANPRGSLPPVKSATGLFFYEQTTEALVEAVRTFLKLEKNFDPDAARKNALRFDRSRFRENMESCLRDFLA